MVNKRKYLFLLFHKKMPCFNPYTWDVLIIVTRSRVVSPVGVLTVPIRQLPNRTGCLSLLIIDAILAGPISRTYNSLNFNSLYSVLIQITRRVTNNDRVKDL